MPQREHAYQQQDARPHSIATLSYYCTLHAARARADQRVVCIMNAVFRGACMPPEDRWWSTRTAYRGVPTLPIACIPTHDTCAYIAAARGSCANTRGIASRTVDDRGWATRAHEFSYTEVNFSTR